MGLANLEHIRAQLLQAGLPASTPAAAVHDASTARQRKVVATLDDLPERVAEAGLESPVTTIVGRVVALGAELDWFGSEFGGEETDGYDSVSLARA
jgi:siroheme synthase